MFWSQLSPLLQSLMPEPGSGGENGLHKEQQIEGTTFHRNWPLGLFYLKLPDVISPSVGIYPPIRKCLQGAIPTVTLPLFGSLNFIKLKESHGTPPLFHISSLLLPPWASGDPLRAAENVLEGLQWERTNHNKMLLPLYE